MSLPTEMLLTNAVGQKGELGTAQRIGNSGGGGGEVTPASIVTATGQMTAEQQEQTRENIGAVSLDEIGTVYQQKTVIVTVTGETPTIEPDSNCRYECGELTSLTISNPATHGEYSIVFTSGITPTTTTFPVTLLGLDDFAAEENTLYEINVLDNRAVVGSWVVINK